MKTRNRILGVVFLVVVMAAFLIAVVPPGVRFVMQRIAPQPAEPVQQVQAFNSLTAYPFRDGGAPAAAAPAKPKSLYKRLNDTINNIEQEIQSQVTEKIKFQQTCVVGTKLADRIMGLDVTATLAAGENNLSSPEDVITVFEDDYLGFVLDDVDISKKLDKLVTFGRQMEEEGRDFLFFMVPGKMAGNGAYEDHSVEKRQQVAQVLQEQNLALYDVTDTIEAMNLDKKSLFFKTDHHWLPSTGLWADQLLCEQLNERFQYDIDTSIFDPENYETTILEKHFLGSQGKKVTTAYCELDDFPIIVPKYDTNLEVFVARNNAITTGSIQETLFWWSALDEPDIYHRGDYALYGYGDQSLIQVRNLDIQNGKRILVIRSSFADCMVPYLVSAAEYLDVIDPRSFQGSLQTFIDETDPDTVIVVHGITAFGWASDALFDFR